MVGDETASAVRDCNGLAVNPMDPSPTDSEFRKLIKARVRVWQSMRNPTVEQIQNRLFWEEYLKTKQE